MGCLRVCRTRLGQFSSTLLHFSSSENRYRANPVPVMDWGSERPCGEAGIRLPAYFTNDPAESALLRLLRQPLNHRGLPSPVDDGLVRPIGTNVQRERAVRRRQPVAFLVLARRFSSGIERQRAVRVVL